MPDRKRIPPEKRTHTRPNLRAWIAAALRLDPARVTIERPSPRRFVAKVSAAVSAARRRELEAELSRQLPPEEELVIEIQG